MPQRRRDAGDDRIALSKSRKIVRGIEPLAPMHVGYKMRAQVLEIILPAVQRVDLSPVHIKPDDRKPRPMKRRQQRQPNVAQPDDADHGLVRFDPGGKGVCGHHPDVTATRAQGKNTPIRSPTARGRSRRLSNRLHAATCS